MDRDRCLIERNRPAGTLSISQPAYINLIIKRLGLENAKSVSSPMDPNTHLQCRDITLGPDPEMMDIPYLASVGSLNWCAVSTRPDISYACMKLASFMQNPTSTHWDAVLRVGKYLKGTRELGITFQRGGGGLVGFTDSDWASNQQDRISTSGYVFTFCGGAISWSSRKQRSVALSSMEAEYNAATSASPEAVWL